MLSQPTWLTSLLGSGSASLIEEFVSCIETAHNSSAAAQAASGLRQRNPYGSTFWLAVYAEFVATFAGRPGVVDFPPHKAPYRLVSINGVLIYPLHISDRDIGDIANGRVEDQQIRRQIFELARRSSVNHGFDFKDDAGDPWEELPPLVSSDVATEVIFMLYASNADAGLLAAGLGQGTLQNSGRVEWEHFVHLDLDLYRAAPQAVIAHDDEQRFDEPPIPEPAFGARRVRTRNPEAADEQGTPEADVQNEE